MSPPEHTDAGVVLIVTVGAVIAVTLETAVLVQPLAAVETV